MTKDALRRWTVLLPIIALVVSAGIVSWEHSRKARLTRELANTEQELSRLEIATGGQTGYGHHH